jgi:hypothetical protein
MAPSQPRGGSGISEVLGVQPSGPIIASKRDVMVFGSSHAATGPVFDESAPQAAARTPRKTLAHPTEIVDFMVVTLVRVSGHS